MIAKNEIFLATLLPTSLSFAFFRGSFSPNIRKNTFSKLLASERKQSASNNMPGNKKDISGWAASTSTEFNDEGESLNHPHAGGNAEEEIDLDLVMKRLIGGRHKDRIGELTRLEGLAGKDGSFFVAFPSV